MIQVAPDIYEKTLKKFKITRILLCSYIILITIGLWGISKIDENIIAFVLLFFILTIFAMIKFCRQRLIKSILETSRQIVMQDFTYDTDVKKWASEQGEYCDKDIETLSNVFGELFLGNDYLLWFFRDIFLMGKKDNIKFSLRGRISKVSDTKERGTELRPRYYALRASAQLIKDNIIIISPLKYYSPNNPKNLPKADIDTGTKYNVYAQKPNEIPAQIREKFVPAVIDYANKLPAWWVVTIITPKDIYFVSPQDDNLKLVVFASAQKQIFDKVAEYKELLEIINAVSLLNKKD